MAYVIGIPILTSVYALGGIPGGGGGVPEITATLSTNDPTFIPNTTSSVVTITLSETRLVDTEFAIAATNANVEITPNPVTIAAGNLTNDFSVASPTIEGTNPFVVSATSDIEVTNTLEITMVNP